MWISLTNNLGLGLSGFSGSIQQNPDNPKSNPYISLGYLGIDLSEIQMESILRRNHQSDEFSEVTAVPWLFDPCFLAMVVVFSWGKPIGKPSENIHGGISMVMV